MTSKTVLLVDFSKIGKPYVRTITDGVNEYAATYVDLKENLSIVSVNDKFYIDDIVSLKKLDKNIAIRYNVDKFFEFIEEEPPKRKRKSTK